MKASYYAQYFENIPLFTEALIEDSDSLKSIFVRSKDKSDTFPIFTGWTETTYHYRLFRNSRGQTFEIELNAIVKLTNITK